MKKPAYIYKYNLPINIHTRKFGLYHDIFNLPEKKSYDYKYYEVELLVRLVDTNQPVDRPGET